MRTLPSRLEFDLLTLRLKPTFAGIREEEDDDADGRDNVVDCTGTAVLPNAGEGVKDGMETMLLEGILTTLVIKLDSLDTGL